MTSFDILWPIWILLFFVIEGIALYCNNYEGTLTAHVRHWFSMDRKVWGWRVLRALLIGFMGWLSMHFLLPPGSF